MAGLFDAFDQQQLARVTETVGTRMAAASALALVELARDDTIDPASFAAGIARAHLLGAASALAGAENAGALAIGDPAAIAMDAATFMITAFGDMRPKP